MKDATRFALAIAAILAATALDAPQPGADQASVQNEVDPADQTGDRRNGADDRSRWIADHANP